MDVKSALKKAHSALIEAGTDSRLETEVLIAHALEKPRSYLHSWPEQVLTPAQCCKIDELLARRLAGEPLAYITGEREFWSLSLMVNRHTLIPRPETETLVEKTIARIPQDSNMRVLDLGTGSGAIALAIASERPCAQITACDVSADALAVAKHNAARHGIENVEWLQGDWLEPIADRQFKVIVSNPPYVAEGDPHLGEGDLPAEPRVALVASGDGLDAIRRIACDAVHVLESNGWLLVEHGYDQAQAVADIMKAAQYDTIGAYEDASGIVRVSEGRRI